MIDLRPILSHVIPCIIFVSRNQLHMLIEIFFRTLALLGLFFISVGTGGIKPCVFTFGGDQFQLPQQEQQLLSFCTKFMIAVNIGSLISTFLMPEFRQSVHCFGKNTCYPLAFGVPAILMLIAIGKDEIS